MIPVYSNPTQLPSTPDHRLVELRPTFGYAPPGLTPANDFVAEGALFYFSNRQTGGSLLSYSVNIFDGAGGIAAVQLTAGWVPASADTPAY